MCGERLGRRMGAKSWPLLHGISPPGFTRKSLVYIQCTHTYTRLCECMFFVYMHCLFTRMSDTLLPSTIHPLTHTLSLPPLSLHPSLLLSPSFSLPPSLPLPLLRLLSHAFDPDLDKQSPREFIVYACPLGTLGNQLDEYMEQTLYRCGRNGAHKSDPHVTLCQYILVSSTHMHNRL